MYMHFTNAHIVEKLCKWCVYYLQKKAENKPFEPYPVTTDIERKNTHAFKAENIFVDL